MGDYKPRVGDRVRVVFEGEWTTDVNSGEGPGVSIGDTGVKLYKGYALDAALSIEKIEPPVVTFKAGDTIRHREFPSIMYSLARTGYFAHEYGEWRPETRDYPLFTSGEYEKIDL